VRGLSPHKFTLVPGVYNALQLMPNSSAKSMLGYLTISFTLGSIKRNDSNMKSLITESAGLLRLESLNCFPYCGAIAHPHVYCGVRRLGIIVTTASGFGHPRYSSFAGFLTSAGHGSGGGTVRCYTADPFV
jgi:hypothetical protein